MSRVYDHRPLGSHPSSSTNTNSSGLTLLSGPLSSAAPSNGVMPPGPVLPGLHPGPPPQGAGGPLPGQLGGPPPGVHPSAARLNDLLEFVKAEFEQVAGESGSLKAQREEYEAMINHHANELNAMRAMSYDLERKHHEDKRSLQEENSRLQDEIVRLRQQLDTRSGAPGPPTPGVLGRPSLPSISAATPGSSSGRPGSSGPGGHPSVGHGPASLFGGDREFGRGGEFPSMREREDHPRPGFPPKPPGAVPALYPSAPTSRPSSTGPSVPPRHQPSPLPSASNNGSSGLPPASVPARDTVSPALGGGASMDGKEEKQNEAFDPETVTRDLKKEGSDWMTMFNPNVKRVLDVGLVHTLVHDSVVCCVRFSPDGKILATGCNRNTTLYDTKTGAKISVLSDESTGVKADNYIRSASFSPDGKLLATGSEDRIVRIWNIAQKRIAKVFSGHKSEIYSLAFSPDGRRLVSGSGDKTARMWDMETGNCVYTLTIDDVTIAENGPVDAGVTSVVMSPDGKFLAAGSLDTVVRIWDASNGQLLDKLKGHKDSVYSVAFSPDGKFLVSGSLDKTLKMWDMATLKAVLATGGKDTPVGEGGKTICLTTLQGHKDYVLSVDISPDGAWIVSGSKDRGVQFWDPRSAKAQFMLQGHKNSVISVAVSDVGGLVATGSGDWSARIWHYEALNSR